MYSSTDYQPKPKKSKPNEYYIARHTYHQWTMNQVISVLTCPIVDGGAQISQSLIESIQQQQYTSSLHLDGNWLEFVLKSNDMEKVIRDLFGNDTNAKIVIGNMKKEQIINILCKTIMQKGAGLTLEEIKPFQKVNFGFEFLLWIIEIILNNHQTFTMKQSQILEEGLIELNETSYKKIERWVIRNCCIKLTHTSTSRNSTIAECLDELKPSTLKETLCYSYCSSDSPFINRELALKEYFKYVSSTLLREDTKSVNAATVMFIGDCPGVGKSRFAYELPRLLQESFNSNETYHFINLAIWFNSGYNPSEEEAKDNLIISTAARMIYSYITHVRSYNYWGEDLIDQRRMNLQLQIYNDLKRIIQPNENTLSELISWIYNNESQFTNLPIWIHLTIDEYNQPFQYITEISTIENWCNAISNIHYMFNQKENRNIFTNLLTGTHINTMINLKESGGKTTRLSRVSISKFNKNENFLLYKQMEMPINDFKLLNIYLSMGGHARLCVEFIKAYKRTEDISKALKEIEFVIGNTQNDRFQLCVNNEEIEFLLALCLTGIEISKDYSFNNTQILKYQISNIIFMKNITEQTIIIEIPLIIISKMLYKISSNSFLNIMGKTIKHWLTINDNLDNFEKFNFQLLQVKLNCFKKLNELKVINRSITIKDLFPIEGIDFAECIIELEKSNYLSEEIINQHYPITNISISPNTIYKNGKSAPFANIFSYLKVKDTKTSFNLFCYLKIKHTSESTHLDYEKDVKSEFSNLDSNKEKFNGSPVLMLFITNMKYSNDHQQNFNVLYSDVKHYFGPFSTLLNFK